MSFGSVFDKINHEYYQLTVSEKKIADYVTAHRRESQFMSISELAQAAEVAEATVSRFCRRLGYKSYNAFKLAVANSTAAIQAGSANPLSGEVLPEDSVEDMCRKICAADVEAVNQTLGLIRPENIVKAADLLLSARRVLCMGQGGSMLLAQEAAHLFATAMPNFYAVTDSHTQAIRTALLTQEDLIFYFSYSGATRDLLEILKIARQRGVKCILVTRYPKSPGAELADVVLECGSNEGPLQLGSVAARMAQLYLVDVLFSEVSRRDMETIRARRKQVAEALGEKHL